jgi:hypothetical protein
MHVPAINSVESVPRAYSQSREEGVLTLHLIRAQGFVEFHLPKGTEAALRSPYCLG